MIRQIISISYFQWYEGRDTTGQTTKGPIPNNQRNVQKDNGKKERESLFRSGTNTYKITKKCQGTRQGRLQGTPGLLTSPDDHKS